MRPEEFGRIMDVSDLVAVHLTRYFPEDGQIKSLNSVFPESTLRNTVHFAINHPVKGHSYGNWDGTTCAIIIPLDQLCKEEGNQIRNFNVVDTYFVGDVKLPRGTVILNSFRPVHPTEEQQKVMNEKGLCYAIGSGNIHRDVYQLIEREGYRPMPGGMWNWGEELMSGASREDQERIAAQLGAERTGSHCDDRELEGAEYLGSRLAEISSKKGMNQIEAFLRIKNRGNPWNINSLDHDAFVGLNRLESGHPDYSSISQAFNSFRQLRRILSCCLEEKK